MKLFYIALLALVGTSTGGLLIAADVTHPQSYHITIAEFAAFLSEKHPLPLSLQLQIDEPSGAGRCAKKITLQRKDAQKIEACIQALRDFDWQNGKREDAPEGSKLAGMYAQLLVCANEALEVIDQTQDEDGNLITTFSKSVSIEKIAAIYGQVPGTLGMLAEQSRGRCVIKQWPRQAITETHSS